MGALFICNDRSCPWWGSLLGGVLLAFSWTGGWAHEGMRPRNPQELTYNYNPSGFAPSDQSDLGETFYVVEAELVYFRYQRFCRDFPLFCDGRSRSEVERLVLRNFSVISGAQLKLEGIRMESIPLVLGNDGLPLRVQGYRSREAGRGVDLAVYDPSDSQKILGMVSLKGTGLTDRLAHHQLTEFGLLDEKLRALPDPSRQEALDEFRTEGHSDGLMSLGEALTEMVRSLLAQNWLDRLHREGYFRDVPPNLETVLETVEPYWVMRPRFGIFKQGNQTIPAGFFGRQSHFGRHYSPAVPGFFAAAKQGHFQSSSFHAWVDMGGVLLDGLHHLDSMRGRRQLDPQFTRDWGRAHEVSEQAARGEKGAFERLLTELGIPEPAVKGDGDVALTVEERLVSRGETLSFSEFMPLAEKLYGDLGIGAFPKANFFKESELSSLLGVLYTDLRKTRAMTLLGLMMHRVPWEHWEAWFQEWRKGGRVLPPWGQLALVFPVKSREWVRQYTRFLMREISEKQHPRFAAPTEEVWYLGGAWLDEVGAIPQVLNGLRISLWAEEVSSSLYEACRQRAARGWGMEGLPWVGVELFLWSRLGNSYLRGNYRETLFSLDPEALRKWHGLLVTTLNEGVALGRVSDMDLVVLLTVELQDLWPKSRGLNQSTLRPLFEGSRSLMSQSVLLWGLAQTADRFPDLKPQIQLKESVYRTWMRTLKQLPRQSSREAIAFVRGLEYLSSQMKGLYPAFADRALRQRLPKVLERLDSLAASRGTDRDHFEAEFEVEGEAQKDRDLIRRFIFSWQAGEATAASDEEILPKILEGARSMPKGDSYSNFLESLRTPAGWERLIDKALVLDGLGLLDSSRRERLLYIGLHLMSYPPRGLVDLSRDRLVTPGFVRGLVELTRHYWASGRTDLDRFRSYMHFSSLRHAIINSLALIPDPAVGALFLELFKNAESPAERQRVVEAYGIRLDTLPDEAAAKEAIEGFLSLWTQADFPFAQRGEWIQAVEYLGLRTPLQLASIKITLAEMLLDSHLKVPESPERERQGKAIPWLRKGVERALKSLWCREALERD